MKETETTASDSTLPKSSPPQTAEAAAKEIISLIRKGSYEEWVQVISEKLTEYSEIKSLEARNKALDEAAEIANENGNHSTAHDIENLKKTV